jgi:hypothetical protein
MTEDAVEAHYNENTAKFVEQGYPKCNNINVRHILIKPAGEQADWTDADWVTAEVEAQAIYDRWLAKPTEDNFAALATEKTMDPGSAQTGGLYEAVTPGAMVEAFDQWCFDSARQAGDHGIVKTPYGYHIMYFVGQDETRAWYDAAADDLLYTRIQAYIDTCKAEYPLQFDYSRIRIFDDVELSCRSYVAVCERTAHQNNLFDLRNDRRLHTHRHTKVCHRSCCYHCDIAVGFHQGIDHPENRMLLLCFLC